MRLSAVFGVIVALLCAGREDFGLAFVLPAFGAVLLFIAGDALRHAIHPASPVRVVPR